MAKKYIMKLLVIYLSATILFIMYNKEGSENKNSSNQIKPNTSNSTVNTYNHPDKRYQGFRTDLNLLYTNHQNMSNQKGC
jgi:hypothetical protein